jgi:uncharacterized membrane protein YgcG
MYPLDGLDDHTLKCLPPQLKRYIDKGRFKSGLIRMTRISASQAADPNFYIRNAGNVTADPGVLEAWAGIVGDDPHTLLAFVIGTPEFMVELKRLLVRADRLEAEWRQALARSEADSAARLRAEADQAQRALAAYRDILLHEAALYFSCFKLVTMPELDIDSMMRGSMSAFLKRILQALSHSSFRKMLERRCAKTGCRIWTVSERLTTKCCSHCGKMSSVGRARTFRCSNRACSWGPHTTSSRDVDSALAIWRLNFGEMCQRVLRRGGPLPEGGGGDGGDGGDGGGGGGGDGGNGDGGDGGDVVDDDNVGDGAVDNKAARKMVSSPKGNGGGMMDAEGIY